MTKPVIRMEGKKKVSKRALRDLLKDSLVQSLRALQLPEPDKRVNKVVGKATRKLAKQYAALIKEQVKRAAKAAKGKKSQVAVAA